jgi:hypothetical protein
MRDARDPSIGEMVLVTNGFMKGYVGEVRSSNLDQVSTYFAGSAKTSSVRRVDVISM